MIVITQKAHPVESDIKPLQCSRENADYQCVHARRWSQQEAALDTSARDKEDGPFFRLIAEGTGHGGHAKTY